MSQDDVNNNIGGGAESPDSRSETLPDDGMIHEWLDGAVDEATGARYEALVASSPAFAERVAEARGLMAAASRILLSLDSVPGGVIPAADDAAFAPRGNVTDISRAARRVEAPPRTATPFARPWARWGSIAALLMVGVTGVFVMQREPTSDANVAMMSSESVSSARSAPTSAGSDIDVEPRAGAAPAALSDRVVQEVTAPSAAAVASMPASPGDTRNELRTAMQSSGAASAKASPPESARTIASPDLLPSPVSRTAERVAADPALRPRLSALTTDTSKPVQRTTGADAPTMAGGRATLGFARGAAASAEEAAPEFARIQSDIARGDLVLAVQSVVCRPTCVQTRLEIASDGRLRRWVQTIGGGAPADTGRASASEVRTLRTLVDSLELASLPAMVRLDGRRCASVGSLRESMRVEFMHEGAMHAVMGLPWCSDGTHALDQIAKAAHALATQHLGAASRD